MAEPQAGLAFAQLEVMNHTFYWPAQFERQVNVLRGNLRKVIDFDRSQVNVATPAQIVDGAEGPTLVRAVDDAASSMQDNPNMLRAESAPELAC